LARTYDSLFPASLLCWKPNPKLENTTSNLKREYTRTIATMDELIERVTDLNVAVPASASTRRMKTKGKKAQQVREEKTKDLSEKRDKSSEGKVMKVWRHQLKLRQSVTPVPVRSCPVG
jgi:hypothetical protein